MVCKHVHYSGRVQGVGFRYTTQQIAQNFPVTGYVRNLPNGDVEVMAEGEAAEVDKFLDAVARRMAAYIRNIDVQDVAVGGFNDFSIRY